MGKNKHSLLIGAHISTAGGFDKAIERGESIGCTAIQIFTKSSRQWKATPINDDEIQAFTEAQKNSSIAVVIAHASYLINIGSPDPVLEKKSTDALAEELERCQALGIPYLVVHPGAHLQTSVDECLQRIALNLDTIFTKISGKTMILLETMAGQGSTVGTTFEQLAAIGKHIHHKDRIGICLDTCHVFAAGYNFTDKNSYEKLWDSFDATLGRESLKAIHVNDSKKECNARVDRHEDIGKGTIGTKGFELIFNDPDLFDIPKILETPKESLEDDRRNLEVIYELLSEDTKKKLDFKKQ